MQKRTLARHGLRAGWAHPYATGPFDPYLYADGGDGDDSGSDSGDGDGDDGGTDDDQDDDDAGGTGDDDGQDDDAGKGDDDKAKPKPPAKKAAPATQSRADKELAKARDQAAKARVSAKEAGDKAKAELVQEIGKALGLVKDDKDAPLDPAALKAQVESTTAAHKSTAIELAVYRGAAKAGVDPDAITDSRQFMASIKDLDPSDEGFTKAVQAAMKKAAEDNPKLKVQTAPKRTTSDFNGGGGGPSSDPEDIDTIRAERRKRRAG